MQVLNDDMVIYNPKDPVSGFAGIPRNMTGMAEHMKAAGYATHQTGKVRLCDGGCAMSAVRWRLCGGGCGGLVIVAGPRGDVHTSDRRFVVGQPRGWQLAAGLWACFGTYTGDPGSLWRSQQDAVILPHLFVAGEAFSTTNRNL